MLLKKDKTKSLDNYFMKLAINLASERVGFTGSNPSVGCIIVKNNEIISFGQTGYGGIPHAEFNAIKNSKKKLKDSTMYVSLEPCTHYGKTKPCTNLIIRNQIKKVFYSNDDIDPITAKKSYNLLKKNKIIVKRNFMMNKSKHIYKSYFFSKKNKIPYVVGKIACSEDNFIKSNKKKYITNSYSLKISHLFRYFYQGILLSSTTVNKDNPNLDCRLSGLNKYSPIKIILDKNLMIKYNSYIVKNSKKNKTIIFYNLKNYKKLNKLKNKGIKLIYAKIDINGNFDLRSILKEIYILGISSLLVEGGNDLTLNFLNNKLFNEFFLFKSNSKLQNNGQINISKILNILPKKFKIRKKINTYLDKDKFFHYY